MRNRVDAEALPIFWAGTSPRGRPTTHLSGRPPTTMPTAAKCRDRRSRRCLQKIMRNRADAEARPIFWAGAWARGRPTTHLSGRPPTTMPKTLKCRDRRSRRGVQKIMRNRVDAEALPIFWAGVPARGRPTTPLSGRMPTAIDRRSRRCLQKIMRNRADAEARPIFWAGAWARGRPTTHLSGRPPTTMPKTLKCRDRRSRRGVQKIMRNRVDAEALPIFWAGVPARGRPTTPLSGRMPTAMPMTVKCREHRSLRS